ncbi:MAG: helix-turn-helix domain-containing protein [Proteobacteria bacterium]|nr:helix-turn-helix domain-containing protein [Pseudomonadota bacterium]
MSFGTRIREIRTAAGMSLEELAMTAKIPWATVHQIENDEYFPRMRELERLMQALDTTLRFVQESPGSYEN